jgi:hypothetical protein
MRARCATAKDRSSPSKYPFACFDFKAALGILVLSGHWTGEEWFPNPGDYRLASFMYRKIG